MKALSNHREKFLEDWFQFHSAAFFTLICLLYAALFLLKRIFILSDIAAFEVLQERGEMWIFDVISAIKYLTVPFFLAWKFTVTAFVLWVGCFLFGYRILFSTLWKWVLFCELLFLVPEFLKFLYFLFMPGDPSYQEFVAFYPLSLMHFVDFQKIPQAYHYPLKALNLFEFFYVYALAVGVYFLSNKNWNISVWIVGSTYGLFFLLWLGFYIVVYH
ncbi:MAG: hypothetical protein OEY56_08690 [Cyclobacteriaceae bacterium]|nr:hypothetical protein [Cyclobacteriaceae bacterium]